MLSQFDSLTDLARKLSELKTRRFFFFFFLPAQKEIKNSGLNRVDKSHSKILEQEPNERERELFSAFDLLFHVFLDSINIITELETEWGEERVCERMERDIKQKWERVFHPTILVSFQVDRHRWTT